MEVLRWNVVAYGVAVTLTASLTGCAFDSRGLRGKFDDPIAVDAQPPTVETNTSVDSGFSEAESEAESETGAPETSADTSNNTDAKPADAASDAATTPDAFDAAVPLTAGKLACGSETCNVDPGIGPVQGCCTPNESGTPYCKNSCPEGSLSVCDERADCIVLGKPTSKCCRYGGSVFCKAECPPEDELP